jgi:hypothetical protein
MDDVHDRSIHRRSRKILVGADVQLPERFPQFLRLLDVDGDELEYTVLGNHADDHGPVCFVVAVDDGYTPGARFEHLAACFVHGSVGVDGDGFDGLDAEGLLDVCLRELGFGTAMKGRLPRRLFKRNWSTRARASGFCQ